MNIFSFGIESQRQRQSRPPSTFNRVGSKTTANEQQKIETLEQRETNLKQINDSGWFSDEPNNKVQNYLGVNGHAELLSCCKRLPDKHRFRTFPLLSKKFIMKRWNERYAKINLECIADRKTYELGNVFERYFATDEKVSLCISQFNSSLNNYKFEPRFSHRKLLVKTKYENYLLLDMSEKLTAEIRKEVNSHLHFLLEA